MNVLSPMLFAATVGKELQDAAIVAVVGMSIVFIVLGLIGEVFQRLGRWMSSPVPSHKPDAPVVTGEIEPRLLAVLTAAATTVLQREVRVHHIRSVHPSGDAAWVQHGRQELQTQHEPHHDNP